MQSKWLTFSAMLLALLGAVVYCMAWILQPDPTAAVYRKGDHGPVEKPPYLGASQYLFQKAAEEYAFSLEAKSAGERDSWLCRSLSSIGGALERQPFDARRLVSWASLRQLLAGVDCALPGTKGSFEQILNLAYAAEPANPVLLFEGAKVLYWAGEKRKALERLREALSFDVMLSPAQERIAASMVAVPEDVHLLVPPRFPQVAKWTTVILERRPRDLRGRLAEALESVQLQALAHSQADFEAKKIPAVIYLEHLVSLMTIDDLGEDVRKRLDELASAFFANKGAAGLAAYLSRRSTLSEFEVVRAVLPEDTRPSRAVLSGWNTPGVECADTYFRSVGFYLPAGRTAKLLELESSRRDSGQSDPSLFQLYMSDNNQDWEPVGVDSVEIDTAFAGTRTLQFALPGIRKKYIKVHYTGPKRSSNFCNSLRSLVKVYGTAG